MKGLDNFSLKISEIAVKVDQNKYLYAIKTAFTQYMPFIIVGSFATLFNTLLCSPTVGLAQFAPFSFLTALSPAFTAVNFATMSTMSLAIAFLIGALIGDRNGQNAMYSSLVALIAFITIMPQSITTVVEGAESILTSGLAATSINAQGLFVAMIVSIIAVEFFSKLMSLDKIKIKMPEAVPIGISRSFNSLIPILIVLLTFSIVGTLIYNFSGQYLSDIIYSLLQRPLEGAMQNGPVGIVLLALASAIFWIFGIHGNMVIMPILSPLALAGLAENITKVDAGEVASNPLTMTFFRVYVVAGGAGVTIALILSILMFSKKEDERMMAKLAFVPGLLGINEPLVFGLPIVLSPFYAIPFILSQVSAATIAYIASAVNFIPNSIVEVPFGLPLFVNAFIGYQTFSAVIVQLLVILVAFGIYTPFVIASSRSKNILETR
ncbi:PTS sugar transporter subunit IIC [Desemzia sp. RIT804]|uniref:PTS sugar transporter subunit IIC n=1 Tax=Desemzia sp. RIT 804 TaxID=2810209 RepID=UPI00194ED114|nr:PTS transporter subunit EIIC [Desemzia sp. RIT 804]MBM6615020.1 PTS sugar transporter subunit IIC [Desemzia sp. RIT 804]